MLVEFLMKLSPDYLLEFQTSSDSLEITVRYYDYYKYNALSHRRIITKEELDYNVLGYDCVVIQAIQRMVDDINLSLRQL